MFYLTTQGYQAPHRNTTSSMIRLAPTTVSDSIWTSKLHRKGATGLTSLAHSALSRLRFASPFLLPHTVPQAARVHFVLIQQRTPADAPPLQPQKIPNQWIFSQSTATNTTPLSPSLSFFPSYTTPTQHTIQGIKVTVRLVEPRSQFGIKKRTPIPSLPTPDCPSFRPPAARVGRVYIDVKNKIKQNSKKIICCHMRAQVLGRALPAVNRIAGFTLALSSPRAGDLLDKQTALYVCMHGMIWYLWIALIILSAGRPVLLSNALCCKEETPPRQVCMSPFWLSN